MLALLALGLAPGAARAQEAGGAGGQQPSTVNTRGLSPADQRTYKRAVALADRAATLRRLRQEHPRLRPGDYSQSKDVVEVLYHDGGEDLAAIRVDLGENRILEEWTGPQTSWIMARGYPGLFGRSVNAPWAWLPLCALFLAPFFDPRRPFRLLHLDLLVLLGFGASHFFFNRGEVATSVPLVYPVLVYVLARMVWVGLRPGSRDEPLIPLLPVRWLARAVVAVLALRIGLNVVDSNVLDVGYAGVIGADHIAGGDELYGEGFAKDPPNGDTYGPVNYLAYVPFVETFGWSGRWDDLPAAHAAAIAFDVLTAGALVLLGRRLRPGRDGRVLGLALAFAWVAYPYTAFVLSCNTNDSLVSLLVVLAVAAAASPPGRGALLALGGAAKFVPLALAPLFAWTGPERRVRSVALFAGAVVVVLLAAFAPFVPPGGLSELYDRTLGFQLGRETPFSLWDRDSLDLVHTLVKVLAVNFALLLLVFPARRSPVQLAALGAAVLIALQLASTYWIYLYVVWWAPLALAALFAGYRTSPGAPAA